MSRNRRRQSRRDAVNAGEQRQHEESPQDPGDKKLTATDVSMPVEEREAIDQGLTEEMEQERRDEEAAEAAEASTEELIAALVPLRRERANPLTAGIRVFTAMLDQARSGYAADRLAELETTLGLDFNSLEQSGILQISMAQMDEEGVPDVEHGVQLCLEARDQVDGVVAEDHGDGEESQVDGETDEDREAREAAEAADRATAQAGEPDDPDAPGPED